MKTKIVYFLLFSVVLLLTSCNGFILDKIYFSEADREYINEHSFEIVTNYPCDIVEFDGVKSEVKGTIPAKTRLKVLAMQGLDEKFGTQFTIKPYFVVELPDGSRTLVNCPEAYRGFRVKILGSDEWQDIEKMVITKKNGSSSYNYTVGGVENAVVLKIDAEKFPRYNIQLPMASGIKRISTKKAEEKLIGKSLEEVEAKLTLADRITKKKGSVQTATFSGYMLNDDSISVHPLMLTIKNDTVTAIDYTNKTVVDTSSKLYKFRSLVKTVGFLYSKSFTAFTYPKQWSRSVPLLKYVRPSGKVRIIISMIINPLLIILTFMLLFPWLIKKMFFYIKPLSNGAVIALGRLMYMLLTIWALFFFGLISFSIATIFAIALFFAAIWIGFTSIKEDVESDRCPYCHVVDEVYFVGKSDMKVSHSTSSSTSSEYVVDKVVTKYNANTGREIGRYNEGHYERVSRKTRTTYKNWKDNLHCNACGKDIVYNRETSDSTTWETGRRR